MRKSAFACLIFIGVIMTLAIFAPWFARYSYDHQNLSAILEGPSWEHWMGTDYLGRDLFSRIIYGARLSLALGMLTASFAMVFGTLSGAIAGYHGGWVDQLIMRLVDVFSIFPTLLMAILLMLLFGHGILGMFMALGLTTWVTQARLVRGMVLQTRELAFVESARALGSSDRKIIFSHIIPNIWGPILVALAFQIPHNILTESFLSFVGLGVQPPFSSWGSLANEGFRALQSYPHLIIFPGGVLFLTMLAFQFLCDGLRDWLDPKEFSPKF